MTITKNFTDATLVLALEGRLDSVTAQQLETEVNAVGEEIKTLVLDFEQLAYISSAGLRVLLAARKKTEALGAEMKVLHVCDSILEVFEITGFSDILTIE